MASFPQKLLATGGMRTAPSAVDHPVLYVGPGSFNSGKALLAMYMSQVAGECEEKEILIMRDNYTLEYARMNPDTMAVPTLRIDDKVCTDSYDLCKYLSAQYPGAGDQAVAAAGKTEDMWNWIDFARSWDEYMYSYGHLGQSTAAMANNIRLLNLRYYLSQVLQEGPDDVDSLAEAYIQKIAGITCMKRAQETGGRKEKDLQENRVVLDQVLARGNELAGQHPNGFLFGDELCTGDAFFLPILRVFFMLVPDDLKDCFERFQYLEGYWERALRIKEVQAALMAVVTKKHQAWFALSRGVPKTMLAYKLGLLRPPKLPNGIEERIEKAVELKWASLRH